MSQEKLLENVTSDMCYLVAEFCGPLSFLSETSCGFEKTKTIYSHANSSVKLFLASVVQNCNGRMLMCSQMLTC